MTEDIRNKFVSWTLNVVKEIKEIPVGTCGQHNNQGNIYGVGVNLSLVQSSSASNNNNNNNHHQRYNRVGVDSVEPAGPAAKAGLKPGDVIAKVDDKAFDDPKRAYLPGDVAGAIRGPEGSEVDVVVERDGKRVEFVLTREPIGVPSPPSSPARKEKAEKKASTVEKQQAKKKKQGISKNIQSEDALFKQDEACTKGETKNENENATSTETNKEAPHSELGNLITSLALSVSEEEQKEESNSKDLASSTEDADQFDDDAADAPTPRHANFLISGVPPLFARAASIDTEISEEKTADDDINNNNNDNELSSILNNSVGDDWDMISERSGSAIVISFSGSVSGGACSFRSASPSMLKNKFVLTESAGEPYIDHVVLPTDTLQGLCLAYKISATRLRMENNFSGNSLRMAPKKLRIPAGAPSSQSQSGSMIRTQDKTSAEFKLYAFVAEIPSMELVEAKAYLDLSNWDLDEALRSAREDEGWSLKGGFEQQQLQQQHESSEQLGPVVAAKPKTLTAMDIHAAPPTFEGAGFELKDIRRSGS